MDELHQPIALAPFRHALQVRPYFDSFSVGVARRASFIESGRSFRRKPGSAGSGIVIISPRKLHRAGNDQEQHNLSTTTRLSCESKNPEFHLLTRPPWIKISAFSNQLPQALLNVRLVPPFCPQKANGPERHCSPGQIPCLFRMSGDRNQGPLALQKFEPANRRA